VERFMRLCIAAFGVLALLLMSAPAGAASDFKQLVSQYLAESEAQDPLFASGIGIHTYDDRLPDLSPTGHAASLQWERAWRGRFAALDAAQLGVDDQADLHRLLDSIDADLYEDGALKPFENDPGVFVGTIGDAAFTLTGRPFAPLETRLQHLAARLKLIPDIVRAAEASLNHPPRVFTELAIDQNLGNIDMYEHDIANLAKQASPGTRKRILDALPPAVASLHDLQAFLSGPLLAQSNGNPRVGAAVFDKELQLVVGTDTPRQVLVARALAAFRATRAQMYSYALPLDRKMFPQRRHSESGDALINAVVGEVLNRLADHHPSADAVFSTAKSDVAKLEGFLRADPVVPLPNPDTLSVVPTPSYMAGVAGASMQPPGPFTPLAGSYYYIDRIPATWSATRVNSTLRENNDYEMQILTLHEAVPGHYVQFRYGAQVPSLVRRVWTSGSYDEGWAIYTEGMMLDAGFGNGDVGLRLFQLKWRLREFTNTIIDAEYHAGTLTKAQCMDLLMNGAFQEQAQAETKWHRLELSHDQLTTYFAGYYEILNAWRKRQAHSSVAEFNRRLLEMGSVEPRYIDALLDRQP
jgi:Bacterial protein of unknown function (DUF885)